MGKEMVKEPKIKKKFFFFSPHNSPYNPIYIILKSKKWDTKIVHFNHLHECNTY